MLEDRLAPTVGAVLVGSTLNVTISGTDTPPMPSSSPTLAPPPFVSVAFTLTGQQVTLLVFPNGTLTEYTGGQSFQLATGIRSASVTFGTPGEIMVVVFQTGQLYQFDATGAHLLANSALSASVGLASGQEVLEVVSTDSTLTEYTAGGSSTLARGVQTASVAFTPTAEVLDVVFATGQLVQFDGTGAHALASSVAAAGVALVPATSDVFGTSVPYVEVLDVLFASGSLYQFDAAGAQLLAQLSIPTPVVPTPIVPPPVVPPIAPTPPAVTSQPMNASVTAGSTATFTASGNPSPSVQWQVSTDGGATWNNVSGATSTTLSFTATAAQNLNEYRAVFTNAAGTATSNAAQLDVNTLSITAQPINQTVMANSTATFTAAAMGNPTPSVQWQVSTDGGATWNNVSGATSTTLSFTATAAQNLNEYRAVFTNAAGTAASNVAYLFVGSATSPGLPFNDSFNGTGQLSSNWTNQVGDYTVAGNAASGAGTPVNLATVNGINAANVSVQVTVSNIASGGFAELAARYAGPGDSNLYVAGVSNTGGTFSAVILKNVGGVWTPLVSQTLTAAQFNGAGTIKLVASGSSLTLTVNATVVTVMDGSLAAGSVGIHASQGVRLATFSAM